MAIIDISFETKAFWGVGFDRITSEKLYQDNDDIKKCDVLKS